MLSSTLSRRLRALLSPHHVLAAPFTSSTCAQAAQAQLRPLQDSSTQSEPECWTSHTKTCFSIRPSLLSPLYSVYRKDLDRHDRRQLISRLLEAHMMLSRELEGFDVNQVISLARDHANSMHRLSSDLEALAPQSSVGSCTNRATMLGFYSLMEQQLGSSSSSSSSRASMQGGFSSVFQAWNEEFVSKYQHSPSLEPLEAIYAKKDVLSNLRRLGFPSKDAQQGMLQGLGVGGKDAARPQHGAHITLDGVACAEGKRKTSRAEVRMRRRSLPQRMYDKRMGVTAGVQQEEDAGVQQEEEEEMYSKKRMRVTVNGVPYDQYFRGPELRQLLLAPMLLAPCTLQRFSVDIAVKGGGISSQAQAARTGIARALRLFVRSALPGQFRVQPTDGAPAPGMRPSSNTKPTREVSPAAETRSLRWLWRLAKWDKRSVERKKPGREKARKGFAWVKR